MVFTCFFKLLKFLQKHPKKTIFRQKKFLVKNLYCWPIEVKIQKNRKKINLRKAFSSQNFVLMRRDLYREGSIYRTKNMRKIEGTDEKIYIRRESIYGGSTVRQFECHALIFFKLRFFVKFS
jgi:hypothetical protein